MTFLTPFLSYNGAISLTAIVILLVIHLWINKVERSRLKTLGSRKKFEAVSTQTPIEDPELHALERGTQNIETRFAYMKRFIYPCALSIWLVLVATPHLGTIPSVYTSLVVGAVSLLFGIAARPIIENIFAGMTMSFSKSVRIGDTVLIDEQYGTIEEITLTHTIVKVWDWRRYVIPNAKIIQKEFLNYSLHDRYLWSSIEFFVAPSSDLAQVELLAIAAVESSPFFDKSRYEKPVFWVMEMQREAVKCWVAGWAASPSLAWNLKHDVRMRLNSAFLTANIETHSFHIGQKN